MTDLHTFATSFWKSVQDVITGDQSTRHEGAERLTELCNSVKIFELLAELDQLFDNRSVIKGSSG